MDTVLILDFGGQYCQLVARRVREQQVYAVVRSYRKVTREDIISEGYSGIILTGGPLSVHEPGSPLCSRDIFDCGVPVLGICYGAQAMAYLEGGTVASAGSEGEFGRTSLSVSECPLFHGIPESSVCWMSHRDRITALPHGFRTIASTGLCRNAAMCDESRNLYAVQFHPEVTHTEYGADMIYNFLFRICGCKREWDMESFAETSVKQWSERLNGRSVLLALSGGVDSSVAAALLHRAVGDRLKCVFVDHGLLRKGEGDMVESVFRPMMGDSFIRIDASERFLTALKGVTAPEQKRKIIGEQFIRVFEKAAGEIGDPDVLAQGTIYPDVIESGSGDSAVIKSHHNVGGLPERMGFSMIAEPLRDLFKDEVRKLGEELGLPPALVRRQPFPGPGLAVRVLGEVTEEKLRVLREADAIFRAELESVGSDQLPSQYFAVLTDSSSVGVKGDSRAYGHTIALRAVDTGDFMTADWSRIPFDILERASLGITNTIPSVTRVVYDITSKPPATVEWE